MLNDDQLLRYSRHILLPDFDINGQQSLVEARVVILGLGGLGSPVAQYLAASGVGHLTLIDDDDVEISNLQRQVIHGQSTLGQSKVASAKTAIANLNPDVEVETIEKRLGQSELKSLIHKSDLLIDGTDNLESRRLHNQIAVEESKPLVSGAAIGWDGQLMTVLPGGFPCYECLYGHIGSVNLNCSESGILSPVVGIVGATMALEAIKVLSDTGESLAGRLQLFDGKRGNWTELKISKDPNCHVCGSKE